VLAEHYGALEDVTERYGSVAERYGVLRDVTEHAAVECYRSLAGCYGTLWNVTEPLRKISMLLVTN